MRTATRGAKKTLASCSPGARCGRIGFQIADSYVLNGQAFSHTDGREATSSSPYSAKVPSVAIPPLLCHVFFLRNHSVAHIGGRSGPSACLAPSGVRAIGRAFLIEGGVLTSMSFAHSLSHEVFQAYCAMRCCGAKRVLVVVAPRMRVHPLARRFRGSVEPTG